MNKTEIAKICDAQRAFFATGKTLDVNFRIVQLKRLREFIKRYENQLEAAMQKDLCKSEVEGFLCDVGPSIMEITETIKGLKKWARSETHFSGLLC